MNIKHDYKIEDEDKDPFSVLDLSEGTLFSSEGDLYVRVNDGWVLLEADSMTAFSDSEFEEYKDQFEDVTVMEDLTVDVIIKRKES